ncbi:GIY-YIG nuclease family protein [Anaerolinea thermolimosa]|uniref:GIY-YIG nuclease family protein n=1 Tax=Anaerolinea thermolimosa TaxID=229919 RepID=UPI0013B38139|nr:GIY-YIG nuclease family protein [Anaerolinea thermolimosa]
MSNFPSTRGTYVLLLDLDADRVLQMGRLGKFYFPRGGYFYVGSARGRGGLHARLMHHLRSPIAPHWHIDWFRQAARVIGIWWGETPDRAECDWVRILLNFKDVQVLHPGAGASDCIRGCPAHLLFSGKMEGQPSWRRLFEEFCAQLPDLDLYCWGDYCP